MIEDEHTVTSRSDSVPQREIPLLSARGISKSFGGVAALKNVDFDLRSGEVHALMGENGAGKSTLMKILSGVYTDFAGTISIDDSPARFNNVRDAEKAGIAIIHQELNLVPELTIAENIFLGREPKIAGIFIDRRASAAAASALLQRLGIKLDPEVRVSSLRMGEQQLVEIAKALSMKARILIMDEPTSALSPAECERLFKIIRQLAHDGVAIIYISHRLDEVMQLSQRVTVFRDGRHIWTRDIADLTENQIIAAMVGRDLMAATNSRNTISEKVVLSIRDLWLFKSARDGWKAALHGVNFDLREGEILGIGGLLGSGRTEILETIFGSADGRHHGEIRLDGEKIAIASPKDARRHRIGLVTEDRKTQGLHLRASITDNVALPLVGRLARMGLRVFASERHLSRHVVDTLAVRCSDIDQIAGTLSGGNQQKVVIGKWLATNPRVLLLDEPTRGIDVGAKREIYDLIFKLAGQGLAIIIVSSELPELLHLADRVLVMSEGYQTGILTREEASEERIMQLAAPRNPTLRKVVA